MPIILSKKEMGGSYWAILSGSVASVHKSFYLNTVQNPAPLHMSTVADDLRLPDPFSPVMDDRDHALPSRHVNIGIIQETLQVHSALLCLRFLHPVEITMSHYVVLKIEMIIVSAIITLRGNANSTKHNPI
jgi:hypothetical protein